MTDLHKLLDTHAAEGSPDVVVGTVVDVRGSAYRLPGARVLVQANGQRTGMISGGCLDKHLGRRAWALTEAGPNLVHFDTRGTPLNPRGPYGSGCDGVVEVFLERWGTGALSLASLARRAQQESCDIDVGTIFAGPDGLVGKRVTRDGHDLGVPDALVAQIRRELRPRRRSKSIDVGDCRVFVETIRPALTLTVFGAGDDVQPLARMASAMGWRVQVADRRSLMAHAKRFPTARVLTANTIAELFEATQIGPHSHILVMTHDYDDDLELLPHLLASPAAFIGLMGPRRRTMQLIQALVASGQAPSKQDLSRVQTPVGVDLGADAPEEVALSVLSGLVAFRNNASGGLLRDKPGAIHDPSPRDLQVQAASTPL